MFRIIKGKVFSSPGFDADEVFSSLVPDSGKIKIIRVAFYCYFFSQHLDPNQTGINKGFIKFFHPIYLFWIKTLNISYQAFFFSLLNLKIRMCTVSNWQGLPPVFVTVKVWVNLFSATSTSNFISKSKGYFSPVSSFDRSCRVIEL